MTGCTTTSAGVLTRGDARIAKDTDLGGSFTLPGTSITLNRMGYGAMQLAGPQVWGPPRDTNTAIAVLEEPLTVLAELKQQGVIRHLGLSNVSPKQFAAGKKISEIVCVQNFCNIANRTDDGFIDDLARQGIAYVPFLPLGGFSPLQSSALDTAAATLQATPMQVALAWLLQRSPKHSAHLRHLLRGASARKSSGGNPATAGEDRG